MLAFAWTVGMAQASELGTTEAIAVTTLSHGLWLGGIGAALSGEEDAVYCSAFATHVALLATPVFLLGVETPDRASDARMDTAWVLYYSGLGATAVGWGLAGFTSEAEGKPGVALMALADTVLIGSAVLAIDQSVRNRLEDRPNTVVLPVATGTF
jgi:hypothetical protein